MAKKKKKKLTNTPTRLVNSGELRILFYTLSVENDTKSIHVRRKKEGMTHISEKLRDRSGVSYS